VDNEQWAVCQSLVASRAPDGWAVTAAYVGTATDTAPERSALRRLLADARRRAFDAVVVERPERLGGSLGAFCRLLDLLDRLGVRFCCARPPVDSGESVGRLLLHVLLSLRQFEHEFLPEPSPDPGIDP
jgi:DNA invertase Pin-like site-specific DNA recombinase